MYRLEGTAGEIIRLFQATTALAITIRNSVGVKVVNNAATIKVGTSNLVYYDFTPSEEGTYLIKWEGALLSDRWEIIDVKINSLLWLVTQVKSKTDEMPPAEAG
jgi:hypothetical protein